MAAEDDQVAELLAQIIASPDNDGPRLVFADWLDQRGDPRGELIHVQCPALVHWDQWLRNGGPQQEGRLPDEPLGAKLRPDSSSASLPSLEPLCLLEHASRRPVRLARRLVDDPQGLQGQLRGALLKSKP